MTSKVIQRGRPLRMSIYMSLGVKGSICVVLPLAAALDLQIQKRLQNPMMVSVNDFQMPVQQALYDSQSFCLIFSIAFFEFQQKTRQKKFHL